MNASLRSRLVALTLALAGLVAIGVGASALLTPVAFFAGNGIELGDGVSLRSEVRAAGGANLAIGVLIFAGAFAHRMRFTATLLVATFYVAFGTSRLYGFAIDGMPSEALVTATAVELVVGAIGVLLLIRTRPHATT
jgi:hypothetical protein